MATGVASAKDEADFSDADFRQLAALARREFGLDLAESKKPLVYSRLSRRLKARGLTSFSDYLRLIDDHGETEERLALISALTTNVTSFFREKHHFETLENALKNSRSKVESGGRFRIWSAGCSSGQEPYSIAMTILKSWPDALAKNVKILATDIDPIVVGKGKIGRYGGADAELLRKEQYKRWARQDGLDEIVITDEPRQLIFFAELNLMESWPFKGPFDAIFCRNVAIYFDQPTQQRLWKRFSDLLTDEGLLFIGHSERLSGSAEMDLRPCGVTSYRKTDAVASAVKA